MGRERYIYSFCIYLHVNLSPYLVQKFPTSQFIDELWEELGDTLLPTNGVCLCVYVCARARACFFLAAGSLAFIKILKEPVAKER